MDGILAVWKPAGMTSFQVTRTFKQALSRVEPGKIKIGHAGTLDPFAEGVLILLIGKATKQFDEIQKWPKTYRAVARLGAKSDTLDCTGKIELRITNDELSKITKTEIQKPADKFVGESEQVIPQYSAAKYQGKPRYKYARKGLAIPEKKKPIKVYSIKVEKIERDEAELLIKCSSGTYIRQLSYDIFHTLGIESYLMKLVRESVGEITQAECFNFEQEVDADKVAQRVRPVHGESGS